MAEFIDKQADSIENADWKATKGHHHLVSTRCLFNVELKEIDFEHKSIGNLIVSVLIEVK